MSPRLYRLYCRLTATKQRLSRKLSHTGRMLLVFAGLCVLFGLNTRQTMMYQLASLSVMLLVCAFLLSLRLEARLRVRRILPDTCTAGENLTYLLELQNTGSEIATGLYFKEYSGSGLPTLQDFSTLSEDGESQRNSFDRKFGYYRWQWLLDHKAGASFTSSSLPRLQPGEHAQVEVSLTPLRRGYVQLGGYSICRLEPLGLMKKELFFKDEAKLLVLPTRYAVLQAQQSGTLPQQLRGYGSMARHGASGEFVSLRDYTPGDPVKHIDWKATARSGEPVVRQFQDEYSSCSGIMLDTYSSPEERPLFEDAVSVAASIICAEGSARFAISLLCAGAACISAKPTGGGPGALWANESMLEFLACVQPVNIENFTDLLGNLTLNAGRLSSLIVILVSLDENRRQLLSHLRQLGLKTEVLLVTADPESSTATIAKHALHPVRLFDLRAESKVVDLR